MSILNLNDAPKEEQKHFLFCPVCKVYLDCRDLAEVFDHIHYPLLDKVSHDELVKNYKGSMRADEPEIEYLKDKRKTKIHTN
jgi:hypothetical protein